MPGLGAALQAGGRKENIHGSVVDCLDPDTLADMDRRESRNRGQMPRLPAIDRGGPEVKQGVAAIQGRVHPPETELVRLAPRKQRRPHLVRTESLDPRGAGPFEPGQVAGFQVDEVNGLLVVSDVNSPNVAALIQVLDENRVPLLVNMVVGNGKGQRLPSLALLRDVWDNGSHLQRRESRWWARQNGETGSTCANQG